MDKNGINYFHVIVGTHWDREWEYPFAYTQSMLVDMMDGLIDLMQRDPEYKYFHMDSQTVVIEDYLRLRPENRDRLVALIREGRILVGPYYALIDETHVLGESIVRNLLIGNKVAVEHGGRMNVGYSPAGFGRVSQTPQILRSVGLENVIFYRGLRQDRSKQEFIWESSDGSRVLGLRLTGPFGRAWYFAKVSVPVLCPDGVPQDNLRMMHNDLCNLHRLEGCCYVVPGYSTRFQKESIEKGIAEMEAPLAADTDSNQLLAMHSIDYGGPEQRTPEIVRCINEVAGYEKAKFSNWPKFMECFCESLNLQTLPVLKGEFRQSRLVERDHVVCGSTISSVGPIKIANRKAELALSRWAEVWDTIYNSIAGKGYQELLKLAWKDLVASQAHDSVTGQGTDEVIDDVMNRMAHVKQAADGVLDRSLGKLANLISMPDAKPGSVSLIVFNPSTFERDEVLKINIDMPFYDCDAHGRTDLPEIWSDKELDRERLVDTNSRSLHIVDSSGDSIDFIVAGVQELFPLGVSHPGWGGRRLCSHRYTVWLSTGTVPPLGYKTLIVSYVDGTSVALDEPTISQRESSLENEFIGVTINPNGSLDITNKKTGRTCTDGMVFEDGLELGSSLFSKCSQIRRFDDLCAEVKLVENNHLAATYEIRISLTIPVSADSERKSRSSKFVSIPISSLVTLRKSSRRLDIQTRVDNTAADHRLRVTFPTGLNADHSFADQAFDVVSRPISLEKGSEPLEAPYATQPSISFADVNDGNEGVALVHLGMIEYEVIDDSSRAITLTLLRCFQDLNKKCGALDYRMNRTQLQGEHEFKYAVYPHRGDVYSGGVQQESESHMLPMKVLQSAARSGGSLDPETSFVRIGDPDVFLSALKTSESGDAIIIRLYNPTDRDISTSAEFWWPIESARLVDSLERPLKQLQVDGNVLHLHIEPKKIVSLEITVGTSAASKICDQRD